MGAVSLLKGFRLRGVNVGLGKVQVEGVGVIWRGCVRVFESSVFFLVWAWCIIIQTGLLNGLPKVQRCIRQGR